MEKIKNNLGKIFIGVCIGLAFFLGRSCGSISHKIIPIKYDTTTVVRHDTIWPDTNIVYKLKPYPVHDTEVILQPYEIPIDSIKLRAFFQKRAYEHSYKSEDMEAIVQDTVIGYLVGQGVSYRLFKPTSIVNSTLSTITPIDTVIKAPKWEFKAGFDATPNNLFFGVDYEKNRDQFGVGYDPFNKQVKVSYKRTLFRAKK